MRNAVRAIYNFHCSLFMFVCSVRAIQMIGPRNIFLIGYRGTGKSTVAQQLARQLGWDWADVDDQIERRAGKTIAAIFAEDGEAVFRELEAKVLADYCEGERQVVALGGGTVVRPANREAIRQAGAVVWLTASVETLAARLAADPTTADRRPDLTNLGGRSEIEAVLAERTPFYRECANLAVDTEGKEPAEVVQEIIAWLGAAP